MDARIRIFLYTLTSQYQNQSFSARDLTNPLRCPDTNRIRVDGRILFVYATCGRRYFCIRIKKNADTKISGYVWTGPKEDGLDISNDKFQHKNIKTLLSSYSFAYIYITAFFTSLRIKLVMLMLI